MMDSLLQLFAAPAECKKGFFGLRHWFEYLPDDRFRGCDIVKFKFFPPNSDVPLILLAIVDSLLRIAGMVAVAFIIYGGIKLITSQGNPEDTARAKDTLINALIGLGVALVAVAFVTFVGRELTR
jgi:hypothetical protein